MQRTVLQVQEEHKGLPLVEIYRQYIKDQFHISKSTFDRWLSIPAGSKLAMMDKDKKNYKQKGFFDWDV